MKWLSKIFKSGSSRGGGVGGGGGRHRQFRGEENMASWRPPARSLDERARADKKKEEADHALALSQADDWKRPGYSCQTDNDEALARALHNNLNPFGCPPYAPSYVLPQYCNRGYRLCGGCNRDIGYGKYLRCRVFFFHPECFLCSSCGYPITENEFSLLGSNPYHRSCFKALTHPKCEVCLQYIPTNEAGLIEYRCHPFWSQKYCPSHEHDNTARCCSCERVEGYHDMPETRGLCLSEELTVTSIQKRPRIGGNRLVGISTQPRKLTRKSCEVTAILVLYGLPRLLTGAILAHELMHAWLRLKGYRNLNLEVEEGVCQVLSYMWLESEVFPSKVMPSTSVASSSSSSSKKGGKSNVENKLAEFFMHQIANDASLSLAYGGGFRTAKAAVNKYGLRCTLDHIKLTGHFPL
ncbi:hypothetical protein P3X46_014305 [Hevea brasiliensis]|uniref:LIM zinc-binding domain-containing protein n=1 Tax=Hevea brasiliensis TaxID=3981 RepID=A0ABQ9M8P8_HEVBR|nr:hypothetical protein P3X46_014305 [Hevea brasiliensis]